MSLDNATIALDADPVARLAHLEADPNLRHTAARWIAHEVVYPDRGAQGMLNRDRDRATLVDFTEARDEFRVKLPAEDPARLYMEWLVRELEHALAHDFSRSGRLMRLAVSP